MELQSVDSLYFRIFLVYWAIQNVAASSEDCLDIYFENNNRFERPTSKKPIPSAINEKPRDRKANCIINVNTDLPQRNEPLFLRRTSSSLVPLLPKMKWIRKLIQLNEGEKIVIACPGKNNYIEAVDTVYSEGSCKNGTRLDIEGSEYSVGDLDCNSKVTARAKMKKMKCAGGKGVIVELGFNVENWITLIEVCHDVVRSHTYYSRHFIHGAVLEKFPKEESDNHFSTGGDDLYQGFNPEESYSRKNQMSAFSRILGSDYAKKYLDPREKLLLVPAQLAPPSDFIFSAHRAAAFLYPNTAPQWKAIAEGNWLLVEENARKLARRLAINLEVITGTEGNLKLQGKRGKDYMDLQNSKMPIPKFFWKILRDIKDESCIAFVSSNNPFKKSAPKTICKDICKQYAWPELQDDPSKGFVYCCTYKDLRDTAPSVPPLICNNVLRKNRHP